MNVFENVIKTSYENELIKLINSKEGNQISSPDEIWSNIHRLASEGTNYGEPFRYLSLNVKKMLAYIADPRYRIEYRVENAEETSTVEALFYWSGETEPAGVGFARRNICQIFRNDSLTAEERMSYLESAARGMAASRAITDAGIGLQFYSDLFDQKFEEMEAIDASMKNGTQKDLPVIPTQDEKKAARYKATEKKASADVSENKKSPVEKKEKSSPESGNGEKETSVITLEDAKKAICDMGSYAGNPLGAIYGVNPRNLIWLINQGSKVAAEARVIVEGDSELKSYMK